MTTVPPLISSEESRQTLTTKVGCLSSFTERRTLFPNSFVVWLVPVLATTRDPRTTGADAGGGRVTRAVRIGKGEGGAQFAAPMARTNQKRFFLRLRITLFFGSVKNLIVPTTSMDKKKGLVVQTLFVEGVLLVVTSCRPFRPFLPFRPCLHQDQQLLLALVCR